MNTKYCKIPSLIKNNRHICSNAKLLYGDILLLCHLKGYCYATNKFLANNLNLTPRTITRLIKELIKENLIRVSYTKNNLRKIYIVKNSHAV